MPTHESDILKPRDPTLIDDNDWPEFLLTNAEVYDPQTGDFTSLLHADEHAPVSITGKLENVDKSQAHLLLKPSYHRATALELTSVNRYSYGIYDDGEIDIWAAGLAGYFKIRPSRAYKPTYQEMLEAVKVLYFIADMHRGQSGRPKKTGKMAPSPQRLFSEYSLEAINCADAEDAANLIYKHRQFLFTCMALGKENINWERTPFYNHMAEKFPAGFEAAQPNNRRLKRKRNAMLKENSIEAERLLSIDREMTDANSRSAISGDPEPTPVPKRRGRPPKNKTLATQSALPLQQTTPVENETNNTDEDSDTPIHQKRAQKGRGKGKSKSALRPKTITIIPQTNGLDEDDASESPVPLPKRKNVELLERQSPKRVLRNNPPPEFDEDEAIDMPSDDDDVEMLDADQDAFEASKSAALPLRWKNDSLIESSSSRPPFNLIAEDMPSSIPQGPGDVWTCTYVGCLRKVYGASKEPGKGLVEEHLKMHSEEGEERVELVKREGELAANLPVR